MKVKESTTYGRDDRKEREQQSDEKEAKKVKSRRMKWKNELFRKNDKQNGFGNGFSLGCGTAALPLES